jgi:hypothetical protein
MRTVRAVTREIRFANDSRQTWHTQPYLNAWELQYDGVTQADRNTLRDFWDLQKGAFDRSWTFPFDGVNYAACQFVDDDFAYTESESAINRYTLTLRIKQVKKQGAMTITAPAFPEITSGVRTQLPYTVTRAYKTLKSETDAGYCYTYAQRETPLHKFSLSFGAITPAEMGTLLTHFLACGGPYRKFSFTDPDSGTVYTNCAYAQDRLEIRFNSKNVRSTSIEIQQFAA